MCPACIATTVWAVAGATGTGGLAMLVATKLRARTGAKSHPPQPKSKEKSS